MLLISNKIKFKGIPISSAHSIPISAIWRLVAVLETTDGTDHIPRIYPSLSINLYSIARFSPIAYPVFAN